MQKLQPASRRELKRIAIGVALGTLGMLIVFALLHRFSLPVLLGALLGAAAAVGNFYSLCLSVQKAASQEDETGTRRVMQSSYTKRMLLNILVIVIGMTVDAFYWLAVVLPLLMPRLVIQVIRLTGALKSEEEE